jgi:hypothetical protein
MRAENLSGQKSWFPTVTPRGLNSFVRSFAVWGVNTREGAYGSRCGKPHGLAYREELEAIITFPDSTGLPNVTFRRFRCWRWNKGASHGFD